MAKLIVGFAGWALAAGDCGNDANFVAIVKLGFLIVQKSDIFAINIQIKEAAQLAVLIAKPTLEARVERV